MKWYCNPKFLCFAGGVAAALVGAKNMKEDAQDLCAEAKQKAAQEAAGEA